MNNYDSVQLKCDDLQSDIDDLDIQFRKEVKLLRRRIRKETLEAEERFRNEQRSITDAVQSMVCDMQAGFQLKSEALRKQFETFKVVLKEGGLVNLDA